MMRLVQLSAVFAMLSMLAVGAIACLSLIDWLTVSIASVVFALLLWRHMNPAAIVLLGGLAYMLIPR